MKRSRAPNFTVPEVIHLMSLIEKYPIIENKKIDGATVKEKHEAWQKLTLEYNSQTNYLARTAENLLACYKNQKIKLKKANTSDKMTVKESSQHPAEDHGDWRNTLEAVNQSAPDQLAFHQLATDVKKELDSTEESLPPSPSYNDSALERDQTMGPSSEEDGELIKGPQHILPIEFPVENSRQMDSGSKRNSFLEFADGKIDLVKSQKELLDLQIQRQELEIKLTEEKLNFERKKNKIELEFLTQKYELELNYLKNKRQE